MHLKAEGKFLWKYCDSKIIYKNHENIMPLWSLTMFINLVMLYFYSIVIFKSNLKFASDATIQMTEDNIKSEIVTSSLLHT